MIARLAATLTLLLAGLLLYETVWASADHAVDACFGQSWDAKTGPAELWWKAVTACEDHAAAQINFNLHVQDFDWNSWTYDNMWIYPFYGEGPSNVAFTAQSGYLGPAWGIEPGGPGYEGMACYRIQGHHWVMEFDKNIYDYYRSASSAECY